ncbi:MAG: hypothetical protein ACMUEL_01900 [Flavobacteriales bacterium Tduv]
MKNSTKQERCENVTQISQRKERVKRESIRSRHSRKMAQEIK